MQVAFNSKEAQDFLRKLVKKKDQIKDRDDAYVGLLSAVVFRDIITHFEREEGSKGAWKAWSKVHAQHMEKIGKGGNKILQDTGRLRQSFQPTSYRKTNEGILWFNPAKTKSGFPYAYAHDEGGPKLPKRDFMYLSDEAKEKLETITLKFLEGDE